MEANRKLLSIIIPVHNAEQWVTQTLDSVLAQTYPNVEIICIDDGSTDGSYATLCSYAEEKKGNDFPIRIYQQPCSGVSAARNKGLQLVNGEYVGFIDADDIMEPTMYEKLIDMLEKADCDITFCGFTRFFPKGNTLRTVEQSFAKLRQNPGDVKYFWYSTPATRENDVLFTKDIHGSVCRSVFKKQIIDDNRIAFDETMKFAEDQVFLVQYMQYVKKLQYTEESLLWYRGNTKPWAYHNLYENDMKLLAHQLRLLAGNTYYSEREKRQVAGYLKCSTYFMIINEEFMFKPNVASIMKRYNQDKAFKQLLTIYNYHQKNKVNPNWKKTVMFVLLKLHLWEPARILFPNKRY